MIRALIFDCFGVLYRGSLSHLIDLCPPESRQLLIDTSRASDYGYISRQEYLSTVSELLKLSVEQIVVMIEHDHVRNDELVMMIRQLKSQSYKTAMLSNIGYDVVSQLFTDDELGQLFDVVMLSSDVGLAKPHPAIYELAAGRLDVATSECVMIDDMTVNVTGAVDTGMQGIVFENNTELQHSFKKYNITR
jgi:glucose-1-phosphatase